MAAPQKDTIYIDIDDEITSIIEKVRASSGKIVALVLPKRATVFQSIVNMKLLKRSAEASKKHIVLITSEAGITPLAGAVGVHVAKTLQSKPVIPEAPTTSDQPLLLDEDDDAPAEDPVIDRPAPLATLTSSADETIEVDNDEPVTSKPDASKPQPKKAGGLQKKLRVPNFNTFRTRLFLGIAAFVLLIVGWVMAFVVLPKATVAITTNNESVDSSLTFKGSSSAKAVDDKTMTVPSLLKQYKKTDTQKVTATGKKDMGTKATGKATLSLKDCSLDQVTIPSGTSLTSGSNTFITQADVILKSVQIGSQCRNSDFPDFSTGTVNVAAKDAGDQYNLSARNYSVANFANVSAMGSAMSGGTSKIVTVVAQEDVDAVKQKIVDANTTSASQTVSGQLKNEGYLPLPDTFVAGDPLVAASPNVGDEASEVTVNVSITYTMVGAQQGGVKQLLEADIKKKIDTTKQTILQNGLDKATIKVTDKAKGADVTFTLQATATAGVQQNEADIKKAIAGKKKSEIEGILLARPGVKEVQINYSPFWVYSTPSSTNKITVEFKQSDGKSTE